MASEVARPSCFCGQNNPAGRFARRIHPAHLNCPRGYAELDVHRTPPR